MFHAHRYTKNHHGEQSLICTHIADKGHQFTFSDIRMISNGTSKGTHLMRETRQSKESSLNQHIELNQTYQAFRYGILKEIQHSHTLTKP